MRVVFLGTGEFAAPALQALVDNGHAVVSAISQPDRPAGRGRKVRATHVHALADKLGIRHIQTANINNLHLADALGGAEIGVVAAFGQKIGAVVMDALPYGCINIHGSLLPEYRGAAPFQWAIIDGRTVTGVTVFQLNERWDAGPIWSRRKLDIGETETATELHDRLAALGADLLIDVLTDIQCGDVQPVEQDESRATRAAKLTRAHGQIDWTAPAFNVARRINGLWSWPAAACRFSGPSEKDERVLLARAQVADDSASPADGVPAGAVLPDGTVQAGRGRVRLLEVKPAGGKLMEFEAFARGRRLDASTRLLPIDES